LKQHKKIKIKNKLNQGSLFWVAYFINKKKFICEMLFIKCFLIKSCKIFFCKILFSGNGGEGDDIVVVTKKTVMKRLMVIKKVMIR
jgi:hypothetical protein